MDNFEYSEIIKDLNNKISNIEQIIKPDNIKNRLEEIAEIEQDENFWGDAKRVAQIQKEKNILNRQISKYEDAYNSLNDNSDMHELATMEDDKDTLEVVFEEIPELEQKIKNLEIEVMLSGENDDKNAIVSIHPGAGGTESHDWASMLYRMYLRWAERRGFKVEVLDYQAGDEAGMKDASIIIRGENAYGYLKAENGIHRLVRVSPFDSAGRRHTSFSSVQVSPEIDDDIDIEIEDKDLRIDTYRASGAGGQHVNKTESAVRITHIPTNIVVQCQNGRSQHQNKDTAFKMLKSKLYEYELAKREAESAGEEKTEIGWGHQIRSYVLFPYQQVKDTRSGVGYSKVDAILDGDIDDIIEDVLISQSR
jgi:peptide chain release factor 2